MKYADDLVLLAKEEVVLQGMIDGLTETGRCYGMGTNDVKKKKTNKKKNTHKGDRNIKAIIPIPIMTDPKQPENV